MKRTMSMLSFNIENEINDLRQRIFCPEAGSATSAGSPRSSSSANSSQDLDKLRRHVIEKSEQSDECALQELQLGQQDSMSARKSSNAFELMKDLGIS